MLPFIKVSNQFSEHTKMNIDKNITSVLNWQQRSYRICSFLNKSNSLQTGMTISERVYIQVLFNCTDALQHVLEVVGCLKCTISTIIQ